MTYHVPRTIAGKLQRVLARVIAGTRKFHRGLGQILHDELHCLDVPYRVFSSSQWQFIGV